LNIGSALAPDPNYMIINPNIFRGESGITQQELERVLAIVSAPAITIKTKMDAIHSTDSRYDFVEF
jgi:hypothetical protein